MVWDICRCPPFLGWRSLGWLLTLCRVWDSWKYHLKEKICDVPAPKQIRQRKIPLHSLSKLLETNARMTNAIFEGQPQHVSSKNVMFTYMFTTRSPNLGGTMSALNLSYYARCVGLFVVTRPVKCHILPVRWHFWLEVDASKVQASPCVSTYLGPVKFMDRMGVAFCFPTEERPKPGIIRITKGIMPKWWMKNCSLQLVNNSGMIVDNSH